MSLNKANDAEHMLHIDASDATYTKLLCPSCMLRTSLSNPKVSELTWVF
jgi:hypothetical protein